MTTANSTFEQKFLKLKSDYMAQLPQKIAAIHDLWASLKARHSVETLDSLQRNVHSLAGTSGTFGFKALSQTARALELTLKPLLEHSTQNYSFNTESATAINSHVQQLSTLLQEAQQELEIAQQAALRRQL